MDPMSAPQNAGFPREILELIRVLKKRFLVEDLTTSLTSVEDDYDRYHVDYKNDELPDGMDIIHLKSQSPTVSVARNIDKLLSRHTIIFCELSPTAQFKKIFFDRSCIEMFIVEEIMRRVLDHSFMPPFRVLKGCVDTDILPKIEKNDILCRLLNLKENDIIEFDLAWGDFDLRKMRRIVV